MKQMIRPKSLTDLLALAIISTWLFMFLQMLIGCKKEQPAPMVTVRYEVQSSLKPFYFTTLHPDNTFQGDSIHQNTYTLELQYDGARQVYSCDAYTKAPADLHVRIYIDGVLKGECIDSLYAHIACHTN